MPADLVAQLKLLGKMFSDSVLDISERLESLEHLSNQHDILLTGVMNAMSNRGQKSSGTNIDLRDIEDI